jgi:peptide/nickel transport system permease protein
MTMAAESCDLQLPPPRDPHRGLVIAAIPVVVFVLVAIVGPLLVPYDSVHVNTGDRLLPPLSILENGSRAWFGTDSVGRDVLAQILVGARVSLLVGAATVALAGLVGTLVGLIAGYFGGWLDGIVMRLADIQLSLPSFLMAILIAGALGPSITNVVVTLALTRWVVFARVVRSTTLSVRTREYVDSARVIGVPTSRLLFRHILPAALTPLLIVATVQFGLVILAEASLSFLGLGTPDSQPSWGLIIANGRDYLSSAWWIAAIPGIFLSSVVVSMGILGDRLRDALDPQLALQ